MMQWEQDSTLGKVVIEWIEGHDPDKPVSEKLDRILEAVENKGKREAEEDENG